MQLRSNTHRVTCVLLAVLLLFAAATGNIRYSQIRSGDRQGTGVKFQMAGTVGGSTGAAFCKDANGNTTTSGCSASYRSCIVVVGDPGSASSVLADDNDSPVSCPDDFGVDWTITGVAAWADAGSPVVRVILTGGSSTSVLTGDLTAGTASWAAGTVQGTAPVVHSFSANGSTCSSTPCSIDVNIQTAGGTAKYIVVKVIGTI